MNGKIAAVFDLDRTLTTVRSVESSFIMSLLRERHIGIRNLLATVDVFLHNIWQDQVKAIKRNKMYLKGFSVRDMEFLTQSFLSRYGFGLISRESAAIVNRHKKNGHMTILITGSPEFLVHPLMRHLALPFDRIYATRLKITGDCYSGDIDGIHYYGKEKEVLVRALSSELGFSLEDSFCYADSKSDIPMMSLFGKPVAVNPDKELSSKSLSSNWKILTTT